MVLRSESFTVWGGLRFATGRAEEDRHLRLRRSCSFNRLATRTRVRVRATQSRRSSGVHALHLSIYISLSMCIYRDGAYRRKVSARSVQPRDKCIGAACSRWQEVPGPRLRVQLLIVLHRPGFGPVHGVRGTVSTSPPVSLPASRLANTAYVLTSDSECS